MRAIASTLRLTAAAAVALAVGTGSALAVEREAYRLGPGDEVTVAATGAPEIGTNPRRVDASGELHLPMAGVVSAEGLTTLELEESIEARLERYLHDPDVAVNLHSSGSQPVSVLGAVRNPGVTQADGRTLVEALSAAGGMSADAAERITITREKTWGPPALPGVELDPSGSYYVAHVNSRALLEAADPTLNVLVRPRDVITVQSARQVYVIGAVERPGAVPLTSEATSVLEALAAVGGLGRRANAKHARVLRGESPETRQERPLNLKRLVQGRGEDIRMEAGDVLFVPVSGSKVAAAELWRAALTVGAGAAIWTLVR